MTTLAVRQVGFYDPVPTYGGATTWTARFAADTLPGSTIVAFTTLSNFAGSTMADGQVADPVNGNYGAMRTTITDALNENWALYAFQNAAAIPQASGVIVDRGAGWEDYNATAILEITGNSPTIAGQASQVNVIGGAGTDNITTGNTASLAAGDYILLALASADNNGNTADPGTGFTDRGASWKWDGTTFAARLESKLATLGGSAPLAATFNATGVDHYGALLLVVTETSADATGSAATAEGERTLATLKASTPGAGNRGDAVVDFGLGGNTATVDITGLSEILSTSAVEVYIGADDSTPDHIAADHRYVPLWLELSVSTPVAGVGFTITATATEHLQGRFAVRWVWK